MIRHFSRRRAGGLLGLLLLVALEPVPLLAAGSLTSSPHWRLVPSPNPGTSPDGLTGVAAVAAADSWAVGFSPAGALIEQWDGRQWQVVPNPTQSPDYLTAVAAVSASDIWAVGSTASGALIEHWDGQQWRVVPNPATQGGLQGITAVSATDIWAVGGILLHAPHTAKR
jgi:hypothetical protein